MRDRKEIRHRDVPLRPMHQAYASSDFLFGRFSRPTRANRQDNPPMPPIVPLTAGNLWEIPDLEVVFDPCCSLCRSSLILNVIRKTEQGCVMIGDRDVKMHPVTIVGASGHTGIDFALCTCTSSKK